MNIHTNHLNKHKTIRSTTYNKSCTTFTQYKKHCERESSAISITVSYNRPDEKRACPQMAKQYINHHVCKNTQTWNKQCS